MTSKEAIEKLEMEYPREGVILWRQYDTEFAIIEKDLELLEKLKSILKVSEHDDYIGFYTNGYINNKDILEIKEWLNEK